MGRGARKKNKDDFMSGEYQLAFAEIDEGSSIRSVGIKYSIPRSTLKRRYDARHNEAQRKKKGFRRVFTDEQEEAICQYILQMQVQFQGLTPLQIRKLAYDYAVRENVPNPFNALKETAGYDWLRDFMDRHHLSHRKPEPTSKARADGFNKEKVNEFFDIYEDALLSKKFSPNNIYNVDETGINVNPKHPSRIVARKGMKQVGALKPTERGKNVTAEICMSATGQFMPLLFIFPLVHQNKEYLVGAPPGTWAEFNGTGWIDEEIFCKWFLEFIKYSKASLENPVLLLLDGHASHIKSLRIIDSAMANGVTILCFPPHCTHKLQPLDVAFMGPVSHNYTKVVETVLSSNGKVTMKDIAKHLGLAWQRSCNAETAINGFKKTGLVPFDRNIFKDSDFATPAQKKSKVDGDSLKIEQCVKVLADIHNTSLLANFKDKTTLNDAVDTTDQFNFGSSKVDNSVLVPLEVFQQLSYHLQNLGSVLSSLHLDGVNNNSSVDKNKFNKNDNLCVSNELDAISLSTNPSIITKDSLKPKSASVQKKNVQNTSSSEDTCAFKGKGLNITTPEYRNYIVNEKKKKIEKDLNKKIRNLNTKVKKETDSEKKKQIELEINSLKAKAKQEIDSMTRCEPRSVPESSDISIVQMDLDVDFSAESVTADINQNLVIQKKNKIQNMNIKKEFIKKDSLKPTTNFKDLGDTNLVTNYNNKLFISNEKKINEFIVNKFIDADMSLEKVSQKPVNILKIKKEKIETDLLLYKNKSCDTSSVLNFTKESKNENTAGLNKKQHIVEKSVISKPKILSIQPSNILLPIKRKADVGYFSTQIQKKVYTGLQKIDQKILNYNSEDVQFDENTIVFPVDQEFCVPQKGVFN